MRTKYEIKCAIKAKREELAELEQELDAVRNAKDSEDLLMLNDKYAGQWVMFYGRRYTRIGQSSTNLDQVTIARIAQVTGVGCDHQMHCDVDMMARIRMNDEHVDPMYNNKNMSIVRYGKCIDQWFDCDSLKVMTEDEAESFMEKYRKTVNEYLSLNF